MLTNRNACRTIASGVLALLAALALSACGGGGGSADATPSPPSADLHLTARNLKFDTKTLVALANTEVSITLDNKDSASHNVSVYKDKSAKDVIFRGDVLLERKVQSWSFRTPAAGSYYFRCDVHPDMNGTFLVQ